MIDPNTGKITGNITSGDSINSPYTVTITVTDGTPAHTNQVTFTWKINPVISQTSNQSSQVGNSVNNLKVTVSDPNGDTTFKATGLPPGLKIDPATGAITGTIAAGADKNSPYTVKVTVTDEGATLTETFTWTVNPIVVITNPGTQPGVEGQPVSLPISATDGANNALTYSANNTLPAGLTIDQNTGKITGTFSAGDAAHGPYTVTITATDNTANQKGTVTFTWNVTNAITITPIATQTNFDGDSSTNSKINLQVMAQDSSGKTPTYNDHGTLPAGLTIDQNTGAITGTITPGDSAHGSYKVTITVTDGTYTNTVTFTWVVHPVVTITKIPNQISKLGASPTLKVSAQDHNNLPLTFTAAGLPQGLNIDMSSGVISGKITGHAAVYHVTVTAKEGANQATQMFTWTVT
jgi:hypothetical protein